MQGEYQVEHLLTDPLGAEYRQSLLTIESSGTLSTNQKTKIPTIIYKDLQHHDYKHHNRILHACIIIKT